MLLIEIALTIWAWNKGWHWYSLIPLGICYGIGCILGIAIGLNGGSAEDVRGTILLDIAAIVVLIVMISKKKTVTADDKSPKK